MFYGHANKPGGPNTKSKKFNTHIRTVSAYIDKRMYIHIQYKHMHTYIRKYIHNIEYVHNEIQYYGLYVCMYTHSTQSGPGFSLFTTTCTSCGAHCLAILCSRTVYS